MTYDLGDWLLFLDNPPPSDGLELRGLLSQAGVPTTDSQGGFGMGSAQTLGAHAGQQRRPPPNKEVDPLRWEPLPMPMETKEASSWGKGL